jgi:hypothetical protein
MKNFIVLILILICAGGPVTLYAQEEIAIRTDDVSRLYRNAQNAESAGDYESALKIYRSILFIDAELPVPYLKMANIYAAAPYTPEAVAMAITMYEKYMSLAPNNSYSRSIAAKTAELRQLMAEKTASGKWQQKPVDLTGMIQSNQKEMEDIIKNAMHPAMKATTKEEIVQAVDNVSTLYDKAQEALENNNIEAGTEYLNKLVGEADITSPLYAQANMQLAELYGKQGNMQKMQKMLIAMEENMKINKNLSQYISTKIKDATPFGDDICGIWVSDLTYSNAAIPYIIMEISKDSGGDYKAIIKRCGLRNPADNSYNYFSDKAQIDRKMDGTDINLFSSVKSVLSDNSIAFVFGDEKLPQKISEFGKVVVNTGIDFVGEIGKNTSEGIIRETDGSLGGMVGAAGVEAATAGIQALIAYASLPVKITKYMDMKIKRILPGYAELELTQIHVREKGNNMDHLEKSTRMRLAKLYPDYNIDFHISAKEEYAKKNKQSYNELAKKISDYCWIKSDEDPDMKVAASECLTFFKYATQGLSYTKYTNANGYFEGWTDASGKMQGFSKCVLKSGYEYIGEWKNDQYSGNGTLVYKKNNNNVVAKYTGSFAKNRYEGKGLYQEGENTYEGYFSKGKFHGTGILEKSNGDILSGIWKKGVFLQGKGTYKDGIFDGKWKFLKKENRNVPHGKGSFLNAAGETITGTWKNDVFIEYKQNKK